MPHFSQTIIISPHEDQVAGLVLILKSIGIGRIIHFETASDAWDFLESARFKTSIKLLFLSNSQGRAASDLLKKTMADELLSHIQVIVLAGKADAEAVSYLRHGAVSLIVDPIDKEKVEASLKNLSGHLRLTATRRR